ncbi:MAG: PhzF family phenazine biosynthesis protein [Bacteroidetes bacterium]|nr:PhzF family phenazine biosynthesis protein [Bacteroidota bacterium]
MKLNIYQVDAFTDHIFGGNPAAIIPLNEWLPDTTLQAIALENNLSETAYFVKEEDYYHLRWFTPTIEIELCGHATLASAHVLFNELGYSAKSIHFKTLSGSLFVEQDGDLLSMDFPITYMTAIPYSEKMKAGLGEAYQEIYESQTKFMVVFEHESQIKDLQPDFRILNELGKNVIVTAKGNDCDFVSRFFAPVSGVDEDPVTGSAHTALTPYWAAKLNKLQLEARQVSARGGYLLCEMNKDRVLIKGQAILYMKGEIYI